MWNEHRDQTLIELWHAGKTASEIAASLLNTSRSAVLGRVHRLRKQGVRLDERGSPSMHAETRLQKEARSRLRDLWFTPGRRPVRHLEPTPVVEDTTEKPGRRLLELEPMDCRWPVGDPRTPEFGFCGCKATKAYGYCEKHQARAYVRVA